jgi:NADH dehydrogenase
MADTQAAARPRVVVAGAGFGGLTCVRALRNAPVEITLLDQRNHHLFQPLLYQVATAGLSPGDIAAPTRAILRYQRNVTVALERVIGVDTAARCVRCETGAEWPYDMLVLATGATHAYFGHDEWAGIAHGLKTVEDATYLRRRILLAFERAETTADPVERDRLMTFAIIGGGPTGVEMAGAIAELSRVGLAMDFRVIDPARARVVLIEAGPRLLPAFPEKLSEVARRAVTSLGAEVRLGTPVTAVAEDHVMIGEERLPVGTVIWAAGVAASPAARWLGAEADRAGRVLVDPDLSVPGHPDIFVIGDTAAVQQPDGRPVPGIAPAAKQMGSYVAQVIQARATGGAAPAPFRYHSMGNLATIGRHRAICDFGSVWITGALGWFIWCVAHIYFLIGFRNRVLVMLQWIWAYFTYRGGTRLITEAIPPPRQVAAPQPASAPSQKVA